MLLKRRDIALLLYFVLCINFIQAEGAPNEPLKSHVTQEENNQTKSVLTLEDVAEVLLQPSESQKRAVFKNIGVIPIDISRQNPQ